MLKIILFFSSISFVWGQAGGGASTSGNGGINDISGQAQIPENIQLLGAPNLSVDQRLRLNCYNSTQVPPHRVRFNTIYDLPFGREKRDWRSGNWLSVAAGEYLFGNPSLSADQRLTLTLNGRPQRFYFAATLIRLAPPTWTSTRYRLLCPWTGRTASCTRLERHSITGSHKRSPTARRASPQSRTQLTGTRAHSLLAPARGTPMSRCSKTSASRRGPGCDSRPTFSISSITRLMPIRIPPPACRTLPHKPTNRGSFSSRCDSNGSARYQKIRFRISRHPRMIPASGSGRLYQGIFSLGGLGVNE